MKRFKEISEQIRDSIDQFVAEADAGGSVLDKTVVEMKRRIAVAKELVAGAIAEKQKLKRAYQETVNAAEVWAKKADAALKDGDLAAAREARQHKRQMSQRANDYEQQIQTQHEVITALKTALDDFYQQFQETVQQAETLQHTQKQVETRLELHKLLAEIEPHLSKVFEKADQKIKKIEAEAEAWEKLNCGTASDQQKTPGDVLKLDQKLAKLKADILGKKEND